MFFLLCDCGHLALQAPEVYESKEYSCTDVFALGMLIYFLFTGERPYAGAVDAAHVQRLITDGKRPDLSKLSVQYQELVRRCWEHGVYHLVALGMCLTMRKTPRSASGWRM